MNGTQFGIGLLLSDENTNEIRTVQWQIGKQSSNYSGFSQPVHITIKRPFIITDELDDTLLEKLCDTIQFPHHVLAERIGSIGPSATAIILQKSPELVAAHQALITYLLDTYNIPVNQYEGEEAMFHITLSLVNTNGKIDHQLLNKQFTPKPYSVTALALLICPAGSEQWSILQTRPIVK